MCERSAGFQSAFSQRESAVQFPAPLRLFCLFAATSFLKKQVAMRRRREKDVLA
jgi:hypothetical protein